MKLIIRWLINAFVLILIAQFVSGIEVTGLYVAIITTALLALVNALIKPILVILTLPINILTLGVFTLVINALLFWFVSSFVDGFVVAGFTTAFLGALIMSLASWFINMMIADKKKVHE